MLDDLPTESEEKEMPKINQEEYVVLKEALNEGFEWITRDKHNLLCTHRHKPVKNNHWTQEYWGNIRNRYTGIDDNLLQFIQWEDEEPCSIQELINDHEYKTGTFDWATALGRSFHGESEETEVKDVEWAKNQIDLEVIGTEDREDPHFYVNVGLKMALNILDQLDTPELPIIPNFVADWIEGNKQFEEKWNNYSKEEAMNDTIHFTIYGLFADYPATNSHVELRKPVLNWLIVDRGNYFKLVNAVRYGYEVEEEQKYYARIKGWENVTTGSEAYNWVCFKEGDTVGISKAVENKYQSVSFTKYDWNNLGINEHNADFVEVEELEE